MRPIKIEFSAFGSFPDEVSVDFESLRERGLFLVTGDTGTGKTTIFDAMSYALFDKMPMKDASDIRSHHASAERKTWVRFTFLLEGVTYCAERHPAQLRPAKRGGGLTEEKAGATLVSLNADGSTTPVESGARKVSGKCAELIGLDENQFQRVMLLAQGAVNRFLVDDSTNREELLATLFGGDLYDRLTDYLKAESLKLSKECEAVDSKISHFLENLRSHLDTVLEVTGNIDYDLSELDRDGLEELHESSEGEREELASRAKAAREESTLTNQQLTKATDELTRFQQVEKITASLAELAAREESVRASTIAGQASQSARPLIAAHLSAEKAVTDEAQAKSRLSDLRTELVTLGQSAGIAIDVAGALAISNSLNSHRRDLEKDERLIALTDELAAGLRDLEKRAGDTTSEIKKQVDEGTRIDSEIDGHHANLQQIRALVSDQQTLDNEVDRLTGALSIISTKKRLSEAVDELAAAAHKIDNEYNELIRRFVETEAPRLASALQDGVPCPVCGSEEHPHPAESADGEPVEFAQVEELKAKKASAFDELDKQKGELHLIRERLGDYADAESETIHELLNSAEIARDENRKRTEHIGEIESHLERLQAEQKAIALSVVELSTTLRSLEKSREETGEELASAAANSTHIDRDLLAKKRRCIESVENASEHADEIFSAVTRVAEAVKERLKVRDEALSASVFTTIEEAQDALMDEEAEAVAAEALANWQSEKAKLEAELAAYIEQGVPEVRPDVDAISQRALEIEGIAQQLASKSTTVSDASSNFMTTLKALDSEAKGSEDLRRQAAIASRAAKVCDGRSVVRINLQRWILGRELERVTVAATVHLRSMTSGRYGIQRVTEARDGRKAFGLDLEILDAHTGRARSPRSLSGGEQFQASLALALGLADVVSQGGTGSGHRIEALFIDEGFGSLDPRALDDAIETLHQLQSTGRTIGAITHVEAMKERLHPGIIVKRHPSGKGSVLTVHP